MTATLQSTDIARDRCPRCGDALSVAPHNVREAVSEWYAAQQAYLSLPALSFDKNGFKPDEHTEERDVAFSRLGAAELKLREIAKLDGAPHRKD